MIALAVGALVVAVAVAVTTIVCRRLPSVSGGVPWLAVVIASALSAVAFFDLPFGSGTDELVYQHQAESVRLSLVLTGGLDPDYAILDPGKQGWPTLLGMAYYLVGADEPYLGIVINAVIAYLAILLAMAAGARIYGPRLWREWLGMVVVASPPLIMYSSTLMRECWAWLTVSVAIHGLIWLVRGRFWAGALTIAVGALIAFWIRSPLAPILVAAAVTGVLISLVWRRYGVIGALVAFLGIGLAGRLALSVAVGVVGYSPEALFVTRDYLADSATTGFPPADPFTPVGLIESIVRVGAGPLPWEFRPAPAWAWVFVNWAYWWFVLGLTFKALRRAGLNSANVAVLAFAAVLLAGLAVGLTNYGIVVRMRAAVIVALLPLAWGILAPAAQDTRQMVSEEQA